VNSVSDNHPTRTATTDPHDLSGWKSYSMSNVALCNFFAAATGVDLRRDEEKKRQPMSPYQPQTPTYLAVKC